MYKTYIVHAINHVEIIISIVFLGRTHLVWAFWSRALEHIGMDVSECETCEWIIGINCWLILRIEHVHVRVLPRDRYIST